MKTTTKTFHVEKKRRRVTTAPRRNVILAPRLAPVDISTASPAIMTRAAQGDNAKRGGPPAANQSRAASVTPGSYDVKTRSFDVILSSFADVKRFGMVEQLNSSPDAWDLSRSALGQVKLLDSHNQGTVGAVLGTLVDVRFENSLLVGRVLLGESDAARAVEADIAAGHLKGVSIGYRVDQWTLVSSGDVDTWRADKITLMEASLVGVPADPGAMIRGAEDDEDPRRVSVASQDRVEWTVRAADALTERAEFYGHRDIAERMIRQGRSEREIMTAVTEARRANAQNFDIGGPNGVAGSGRETIDTRGHIQMHGNTETLDNPAFVRQTLEDALYARMSGRQPEGAARQFVGARLGDYEDILAEADGERRSWLSRASGRWPGGGARAAHTTSDFPNLLLGAGNRVLLDAYQMAQSPMMLLSRQRMSADFRPVNTLRLSEAPELLEIKESGEVKYGSRGEEAEAFSVKTFARLFSLSRQAYLNDDLSAFADSLQAFGRAAGETAAGQMVALFTANAGNGVNLSDGNALFTTARGNKAAAGAAISVDTLGAARQALRETKGLDGKTPIGLTPRFLVVGPAKETEAEQAISQILANQVSNANPFAGKLEVLVEPRLTGNAWRLFADPAQQSIISHAFLNGRNGPILETRDGWTTLGVEFRAILDFGCGATDWRGAYLNPGN